MTDRPDMTRYFPDWPVMGQFKSGDLVQKKSGSQWHGKVVGWYSTDLTPIGYAVESYTEKGSVQIYPEKALEPWQPQTFVNHVEIGSKAGDYTVRVHGIVKPDGSMEITHIEDLHAEKRNLD
jgi:hypothetical protein